MESSKDAEENASENKIGQKDTLLQEAIQVRRRPICVKLHIGRKHELLPLPIWHVHIVISDLI